jgi:3-oxoacyl-[acyl-carrier-protein] synthase II
VTGRGAVTPVGNDAPSTWSAVREGRTGLANVRPWLEEQLPGFTRLRSHVAGRASFHLPADSAFPAIAARLPKRQYDREVSRAAELGLEASAEALVDAGLVDDELALAEVDSSRVAVVLGSGIGGAVDLGARHLRLLENARPHSTDLYRVQPDNPTVVARRFFGAEGASMSTTQACASGAAALALGTMLIETGMADVVVAGGAEALGATMIALFESTGAANDTDDPLDASRPLDVNAQGAVLAEGAGVLVLEGEDHAVGRGARVRGVLAGYGVTGGKGSATLLDETGVLRAMTAAVDKAGVGADDGLAISPHATGTRAGDRGEANAICRLMDSRTVSRVFPVKGSMGHTIGASGGIEAVLSLMALDEMVAPPAATTREPLPELARLIPVTEAVPLDADFVLSNSMGFGDQNVALIVAKP